MNLSPLRIKKILLFRTDRFGEFILTLPAIHALKEKFPNASSTLFAHPYSAQLILGNSEVDEIIEYKDAYFFGLIKTIRLINEIRKRRFDLAVIFNPNKKFNIVTFLAGIPIRIGYDRKWGFLLTHRIKDKKFLGDRHEIDYNLDLVCQIGANTKDKSLAISVNREDETTVDSLLKENGIKNTDLLVAIHPWTSDPIKQWPLENFSLLIKLLNDKFLGKFIIIGGEDETGQSKKFCEKKSPLINLTGRLTLRQLAAFLKRCRCLVSNDSGPVHLAAGVGTPVVVIFRNDIPAKSSKRWGPWGEGHIVIEKEKLELITVEEVLAAVKKILEGRY